MGAYRSFILLVFHSLALHVRSSSRQSIRFVKVFVVRWKVDPYSGQDNIRDNRCVG